MGKKVRAHAIISGRVQGVFFRVETKRAAERNQVVGWVRNRMDGTVEAVFEGEKKRVEATLAWCGKGPPHSLVENVKVQWQEYSGAFTDFGITH